MERNLKKRGMVYIWLLTIMILSVSFCIKNVSADSVRNCKVTFADSKGKVSGEYYRKQAKTVEKGSVIELPKAAKKGYQSVWLTKINGKEYKYSAGSKVKIEKNTKFCLKRYKLYTVRFFTANGKKEYKNLRKTVASGKTVVLPSMKQNADYKFTGWSVKKGEKITYKKNEKIKVTSDLKFCAVRQKRSDVRLCRNDGTYWKGINNRSNTAVFPAVDLESGDMCLGWSRTKGRHKLTSSDYKVGDKIPSQNGKYYMVVFTASMDLAPSETAVPTKYDKVYIVGDSRSVDTQKALGTSAPSNVRFIAKGSQGLSWFKDTAYQTLLKSVSECPKNERKAVLINLGVNDLGNSRDYVKYMKKAAAELKKYNCTMYYLSVNPVNSKMIVRAEKKKRTEAQVDAFNKKIYKELCSGKNKCFT